MYEHEQKKHRETEELRAEEARLQQQEQRLRQARSCSTASFLSAVVHPQHDS
jgi:hypothetical protein